MNEESTVTKQAADGIAYARRQRNVARDQRDRLEAAWNTERDMRLVAEARVAELEAGIEAHRDGWITRESDVDSDATLGNPAFDPFAGMNERLWNVLDGEGDRPSWRDYHVEGCTFPGPEGGWDCRPGCPSLEGGS